MKSFIAALEEFLLAQEADGSTAATLRWYKSLLEAFAAHAADRRIGDITASDIRLYIVAIRGNGFADATVSAHTRALHKFWAWSAQEYGIVNPMRNIKYPNKAQPRPRAAAIEDIQAMFKAAGQGPAGFRDRAIIAFLLDTGCRAAGLCSLRLSDLDLEQHRAIVTEKGNKTRSIVFTSHTAQLVKAWMAQRQPEVSHVFYALDKLEPMTPNGLYQMLRRLAKRAGVAGRFNPHALRHTFAREYIKNGGDLATLSLLMGHRDVSTTVAHYTVFTDREIQDAHERYSPVGKLLET